MQNEILDQPFDEVKEEALDLADTGKRLINYIIDRVITQVLAIFGSAFLMVGGESADLGTAGFFENYFTVLLFLFGYYTVMEAVFNGKTIGKLITRTRAVREDGSQLGWDKAALRTLCRMIPFEPFSFLAGSRGWHDSLSNTFVVNDRRALA